MTRHRMLRWPLAVALGMLLTLHAHGQAEENTAKAPAPGEAPVIGQPFPQLRLPTLDGKATIDTADLKGRRVLLIEFASW